MVYKMLFQRSDLPMEERIKDLISRLTLEEKVSQLLYDSAAIPHLGIPEYNWWNECLHGVARAGTATVFPRPSAWPPASTPRSCSRWRR